MEINVNGINLYYEECGEGAPIILLHGNGESHKIYDRFVSDLSSQYKTYAIDSRCHGESDNKCPLSYDLMTNDVAEFIKSLDIKNPTIIGFSDGGIVALLLAINYPNLIGKIITLGANTNPCGMIPKVLKLLTLVYKVTKSKKFKMMITEPNITAEQLNSISIPAVIIAGTKDVIAVDHTKYIAKNIKNATLELLDGEGHTSYVINSPKLYKVVKKYLD